MTSLTAAEQAVVRNLRYALKRYLSFCPREAVFACRTTANSTHDAATGAQVALEIGQVLLGVYTNVKAGMTLDVGTTLFGREIASVRIRKDASATELFIAETGGSDLLGNSWNNLMYLTVRDERRLWPRMPYMSKNKSGEYFDTFDYTVDYDVAYTDQTLKYPPVVNITGRIAGFADAASESIEFGVPQNTLAGYIPMNKGAAYAEVSYTGITATASSDNSGANPASNAFDGDLGTSWISDNGYPHWLKCQFPTAKTLAAYTVIPLVALNYYPTAWTFEGSNNDSDWDTLDTQTGQSIKNGYARTYAIASPASYLYYRLTVTGSGAPSYVGLRELDLHESVPAQTELDQEFILTDSAIEPTHIDLFLRRVGSPSGTLTVNIETDGTFGPSGSLISASATGTAQESAVSTAGGWVRFAFAGSVSIDTLTYYHIRLSSSSSESTTNYIEWAHSSGGDVGAQLKLIEPNNVIWGRYVLEYDDHLFQFVTYDAGNTRAVTLSAADSEAVADGASISTYAWGVIDGEFESGYSASDATVRVRFPVNRVFRYITCTVTDSNGTSATRYYPIFVHSDAFPPLPVGTGFTIDRDDTTMTGREMDLTVYGPLNAAHEGVLPKGTLAVYWEDITFDGQEPPDAYRSQFMGWVSRDTTRLALHRDQYFLTLSGPGYWLQEMRGFALSFLDRSTPSEWYHMADPTDDRAAATILRYFTTFLDLCGMHQSGFTTEWHQPTGSDYAAIQIEKAAIWDQLTYLASEYSGVVGCDTNGDVWFRRHPCLLISTEAPGRDDLDVLIDLTPADRVYDTVLEIPGTVKKPYGLVQLDGFFWDGAQNHALRARAPGRVPGYGVQEDIKAAQCLTGTSPSTASIRLTQRVGHWYAWLNGPVKDVAYELVANLDVAEPARMDWITVTENANLRGLVLDQTRFLVERVSIQHAVEPGAVPKRVTWHIAQETAGQAGKIILIPQSAVVDDYWFDPDDLVPGGLELPPNTQGQWMVAYRNKIAAFNTNGYLYITSVFRDAAEPTWTCTDLALDGTIQGFVVDAFSPGYLSGSGAINGWLVTTTRIYRISDIFGSVSATSQKTFRTPSGSIANHSIDASFGAQGHVVVVSYYGEDGTYCTYSTDGVNWSTETQITAYYQTDTVNYADIFPGVQVSSKTAGLVYTTAFSSNDNGTSYVSTNYGASWSACNGTNGPLMDVGIALATDIHVPYGHADELLAYHGKISSGTGINPSLSTDLQWVSVVESPPGTGNEYNGDIDTLLLDDDHQAAINWSSASSDGWNSTYLSLTLTPSGDPLTSFKIRISGWAPVSQFADPCPDPRSSDFQEPNFAGFSKSSTYDATTKTVTYTKTTYTGGNLSQGYLLIRDCPNDVEPWDYDFYYTVIEVNGENVYETDGARLTIKTDGAVGTDISPDDGSGNTYGPYGASRWRITSAPTDADRLLATIQRAGDTGARVFTSTNGGASWTPRTDDDNNYLRGAISGDDPNTVYTWGASGSIGLSTDGGATIADKSGNIADLTPTPGVFVGICGGTA